MIKVVGIVLFLSVIGQDRTQVDRSIEARLMLNQIYALEQSYFWVYSKYSERLEEVEFEQEPLVTEGGQANYRLVIEEATSNSFVAKAIAVVDFDGDGKFNVWQIDQNKMLKEVERD